MFCFVSVPSFLVKEDIPAADIHHSLQRVYGDVCMGASSIRQWVKHFNTLRTGEADLRFYITTVQDG